MRTLHILLSQPRLLLFDIETSLSLGYFFGKTFETNIVEVREQSFLLSFSYKWLHEKKIHTYALPDFQRFKRNKHDDGHLVRELAGVLAKADIVVAHNGDSFDIKTTNTRMLYHGFDPIPPFKTIDTCKQARKLLKLPSNKLDDIGEYYGIGRKLPHTGKDLWLRCMNGDRKAYKEMKRYNTQDVALLESVYLKMRPYIKHPNIKTPKL